MNSRNDLGAVVLCGGQSRRMGQPKTWLPFGQNEVLLQRITRRLARDIGPIVVVAAPGQSLPELASEIVIAYDEQPDCGPLGGLAAGLALFPESIHYVYATGTDFPFLTPGWISALRQAIGDHDAAVPVVEGRHHPLSALYHRSRVLPTITRNLQAGRLRLMEVFEHLRVVSITEETLRAVDSELLTLWNLNTFDDYQQALAMENR